MQTAIKRHQPAAALPASLARWRRRHMMVPSSSAAASPTAAHCGQCSSAATRSSTAARHLIATVWCRESNMATRPDRQQAAWWRRAAAAVRAAGGGGRSGALDCSQTGSQGCLCPAPFVAAGVKKFGRSRPVPPAGEKRTVASRTVRSLAGTANRRSRRCVSGRAAAAEHSAALTPDRLMRHDCTGCSSKTPTGHLPVHIGW